MRGEGVLFIVCSNSVCGGSTVVGFSVSDLVGLAGAPLVLALVQLVRVTFPALPTRFLPALTLVVAIGLNLGLSTATGAGWVSVVLVGMVTGLTASGLYSHAVVGRGSFASPSSSSSSTTGSSITSPGASVTSRESAVTSPAASFTSPVSANTSQESAVSPASSSGGLVANLVRTGVLERDREPWAWRRRESTSPTSAAGRVLEVGQGV